MNYLKPLILVIFITNTPMIFNFTIDSDISKWRTVDDTVMGGKSYSKFSLNEKGFGVFEGDVSTENNGGFSSVRYRFEKNEVEKFTKFVLRVKGDGKRYQFRVKSDVYEYHSYIGYIETTGNWQTIEVEFSEMYPTFRGRKLGIPNYPAKKMEEIAFLIGNKKRESFKIEIDKIELK